MPNADLMQPMVFTAGYRSPSIAATLIDSNGERYHIPAGATIKFRMVKMSDSSVKVDNATATSEQVDLDPTTWGGVRYDWAEEDIDTSGKYWGWFIVVLSDLREERWPPAPQLRIEISEAP